VISDKVVWRRGLKPKGRAGADGAARPVWLPKRLDPAGTSAIGGITAARIEIAATTASQSLNLYASLMAAT
jgi:hypothetical protein